MALVVEGLVPVAVSASTESSEAIAADTRAAMAASTLSSSKSSMMAVGRATGDIDVPVLVVIVVSCPPQVVAVLQVVLEHAVVVDPAMVVSEHSTVQSVIV